MTLVAMIEKIDLYSTDTKPDYIDLITYCF